MYRKLFINEWRAFRRSSFWTQSVIQNIILALFGLYLIMNFIGAGMFIGKLIQKSFPDTPILDIVNRFLIYYFLSDILIRYFLQKFPSINLSRYLTLNIKKESLSKFLVGKSLFSFFNIAPLFFFIPFYVINLRSTPSGLSWLCMTILIVVINHFLSFYISRNFGKKSHISFIILGIISLTMFLDYKGYFSLGTLCSPVFDFLYLNTLGLLFLFAICIGLFFFIHYFLKNNAYLQGENITKISKAEFALFNAFGPRLSKLMQLESKLIWRNKRPRHFLYISIVFLLYPLAFLNGSITDSYVGLLFISCFLTGAFAMNYGQLFLSWNSQHFDLFAGQNIKMRDVLVAKFYLLALTNIFLFFMSLPWALKFPRIIETNIAMFLFNTGVVIFMYMFLSIYGAKKIQSNVGSAFNYEGISAGHFLIMIPIILVPILIYLLFRYFDQRFLGIITIGLIGLIGILLHSKILDFAANKLQENKYKLISNFNK